ncbi:MAG: response regulator [Acidobacteria bacterium]|nr:response regulator [Acidobacteriota bacterium]
MDAELQVPCDRAARSPPGVLSFPGCDGNEVVYARGLPNSCRTAEVRCVAPKSAGIRVKEIPEEREPSAEEVLPALSSVAEPVTPPPEIDPDKRALLGEDNPVNGAVAIRVLEKLGFEVDTVTSGWEAVQLAGQNTYSVILLDCDSPAIGGYHTVMEIRDRENPKGIWTPILALTAYTMQWDRQQREAAGIDGYIAKPIQVDAMKAVLSRFAEDQSRPATMQLLALDRNMLTSLRKLTDGDGNQLEELVHLFIETSGRLLDQMETGLASGDLPSVAMAAHSMRGSSGQVGAKRMEEISSTIEALSRTGAGSGLGDWIQELRMTGCAKISRWSILHSCLPPKPPCRSAQRPFPAAMTPTRRS